MSSIDDYSDVVIYQIAKRLDYDTIQSMKETSRRIRSILSDPLLWIDLCERDHIIIPSLEFRRNLNVHAKRENDEYECQWNFEHLWASNPFGSNLVPPILEGLAKIRVQYGGTAWNRITSRHIAAVSELQKKYRCRLEGSDLLPHLFPVLPMLKWKYEWEDRGIAVEEPPFECERHPDIQQCIATGSRWGDRRLAIDLVALGVPEMVLDHIRPRIIVSELAATREDCRTRYFISVQLLREDEKFSNSKTGKRSRFRRENRYWQRGTTPANWERVELILENYPIGMRKICVESKGSDHEDPRKAGRCGSKYANLEIRIEMPNEVRWLKEADFPDV